MALQQEDSAVQDTLFALLEKVCSVVDRDERVTTPPPMQPPEESPARLRRPRIPSGSSRVLVNGDGSRLPTPFDPTPITLCLNTRSPQKRWSVALPSGNELKYKLDAMQRELQTLQLKNQEITSNYRHVLQDLETAVKERKHVEATLDEVNAENYRIRSEKEMASQEKQLLQQQLLDARLKLEYKAEELTDLKEQIRQFRHPPAMDTNAWADNLIKQYDDVSKTNHILRTEMELLREQMQLMDERNSEIQNHLDIQVRERRAEQDKHRADIFAAYQQMHKSAQDRDMRREQYEAVLQQLEELQIERTRHLSQRQQQEETLQQLRCKYEHTLGEYRQVMGERGQVLKEINELTDEKEGLATQLLQIQNNGRGMEEQITQLRIQIDQQQMEKEKLQERLDSIQPAEQRSLGSLESEVADITRTALEKEVGELRQRLEASGRELEANRGEISEARSRRDWALSERERIVSERESMRSMCDQLRRERDEAITKLANAIKDSDDLQRQREKAERALKEIKDKFELDLHHGREGVSISPSHSRDSAIDTDLAEWDIETMEVNMSGMHSPELGVELRGGRDDPLPGSSTPIYVKSISKGSKLDGPLRVFDWIMQVNDIDVCNMEHRSVIDILQNSKNVKMVIKRRRLVGMKLISVPLNTVEAAGESGFLLEDGVYISKIKTSSAAAKAGNLAVGDRIIYINDIPVQGKSAPEVSDLCRQLGSSGLVLAVMKSPPVLSPVTPTTSFPHGFSSATLSSLLRPSTLKKPTIDQGAQTASLADLSLGSPHKSKGNLLDKVHDKIFGKPDKKQRAVVASATIPMQSSTDALVKRPLSTCVARSFASGTVSSGSQPRAWAFSSDRRNKGSLSSTVRDLSPEQKVLSQFDDILNNADTLTNKNIGKAVTVGKESGSTWPKYKENAISDDAAILSTITPRIKKPSRPSVFPVFPPRPTPTNDAASAPETSPTSTMRPPAQFDAPLSISHPVSPAHSQQRPTSYHPLARPQMLENYVERSPRPEPRYGGNRTSRPPSAATYRSLGKSVHTYEDPEEFPPSPRGLPAAFVTDKPYQVARAVPYKVDVSQPGGMPPPPYPGAAPPYTALSDGDSLSITSQSSNSVHTAGTSARQTPTKHVSKFAPPYHRSSPHHAFYPIDRHRRLSQGDVRKIIIERGNSCECLGISVDSRGQGVFISCVSDNSLAARNGVHVGDQLLDVCGVNLRQVDLHLAKKVLRDIGRNEQITLTVQYNPTRYHEMRLRSREGGELSSANSTPRATPNPFYGQRSVASRESSVQSSAHSRDILGVISENDFAPEPRWAYLTKKDHNSSDWGFSIIGGNAVGVFVDGITKDGPADGPRGLMPADQILEFNGTNFRNLTFEQAQWELQRQADDVNILVQQNEYKYQKAQRFGTNGDSFYIRVNVDRPAENTDELALKCGDIVYVDNTMFMGKPGRWRAWRLDSEGRERLCGIIPSRERLEREVRSIRTGSELSTGDGSSEGGGSRRGTIRRSLKFIRRSSRGSQHQRTPSKESASKDTIDSNDPINFLDELYQRVERLDYKRKRPVLIVGAVVEPFVCRLVEEYAHMFARCVPECVKVPSNVLEQGLNNGIYVDCRKRDKLFEVTAVAAVKEVVDKGFHCIMDVGLQSLERLQHLQIYPIVIVLKFKSTKQVKELCEFSGDRINSKIAKDLMDRASHLEQELNKVNVQHCTVQATPQPCAEHTLRLVCQQIVSAIEHEQKKTLWILCAENL